MPKRYHMSEQQKQELEEARRKNKDKNVEKRLKALQLHAQGEKRAAVAEKTGFAISYISELVRKYCNNGLSAIVENHYAGNRRNMSFGEEECFLEPYKRQGEQGEIIEVGAIKLAYEAAVGHSIGGSQIYYVLHRHGWRKIMPRSKHPNKASDEVIETSKKLTQLSGMKW